MQATFDTPTYWQSFFRRVDQLHRRRQPRRTIGRGPQGYTKLNPTYRY